MLKAKSKNKTRGVSLLAVILVMILFAILGYVGLSMLSSGSQRSVDYLYSEKAFHIAEAGIQAALRTIKDHWDWSSQSWEAGFDLSLLDGDLAEGTFLAEVTGIDNKRARITSTGNYQGAYRTITMLARKISALDFAIYTNNTIDISGSAYITGDVMETSQSASVSVPEEHHTGELLYDSHGTIPTLKLTLACDHTPTCINNYKHLAIVAGTHYNPKNTEIFTGTPLNGIIYVDGDLKIAGNCTTTIDNPRPVLVVMGNLNLTGTINFKGLIYVSGDVTQDESSFGNSTVEGEIISGNPVTALGNFSITYNEDYVKTDLNMNTIDDTHAKLLGTQFEEQSTF